jgi:hypothetical protein
MQKQGAGSAPFFVALHLGIILNKAIAAAALMRKIALAWGERCADCSVERTAHVLPLGLGKQVFRLHETNRLFHCD